MPKKGEKGSTRKIRPAMTPEGREQQMIALAVDLAEQQLLDGTASAQVITHFLKLGSMREQLEREKLKQECATLAAKRDVMESSANAEKLYSEALAAMRSYSGRQTEDEDY